MSTDEKVVRFDRGRRANSDLACEQILVTTLRGYQKIALEKITIEHIAKGAKISPTTLYGYFNSRDEILAVLAIRIAQNLMDHANKSIAKTESFAEFIVETIVITFDRVSQLPFCAMVRDLSSEIGLTKDYNKQIFEIASAHFKPRFDEANTAGLLRSDMDFNRFVEWVIHIGSAFIRARFVQYHSAELREMPWCYLVPGVVGEDAIPSV